MAPHLYGCFAGLAVIAVIMVIGGAVAALLYTSGIPAIAAIAFAASTIVALFAGIVVANDVRDRTKRKGDGA